MQITRGNSTHCLSLAKAALFASCLTLGLAGCNRGPDATTSGWTQAALQMPSGIAASQLPAPDSREAQLTARYCSKCHGIPSPSSQTASDWVPIMRRMMLRMERSGNMDQMMGRGMVGRGMMGRGMMGPNMPMGMMGAAVPTPSEEQDMLAYLQNHALKSIPEEKLPETATPAAMLYKRTCSRCHALPDPGVHTPEQWPATVSHMRQYMQSSGVPGISDEQAQTIINYLRRAARQ